MASGQWAGSKGRAAFAPNWAKLRNHVLKRDGRQCRLRLPVCIGVATHADHIVPRSEGGSDDPSNLQAACVPCHSEKSSREGGQAAGRARRAMVAARKRPEEAHPGVLP
jgi:5-methylcytosine-specific restriction enzyme A